MREILEDLCAGNPLGRDAMRAFFRRVMAGHFGDNR